MLKTPNIHTIWGGPEIGPLSKYSSAFLILTYLNFSSLPIPFFALPILALYEL